MVKRSEQGGILGPGLLRPRRQDCEEGGSRGPYTRMETTWGVVDTVRNFRGRKSVRSGLSRGLRRTEGRSAHRDSYPNTGQILRLYQLLLDCHHQGSEVNIMDPCRGVEGGSKRAV